MILYVSAIDERGNLCFAFNEDKTQRKKYLCPNCGVPVILRKSDNVGKYAKRPHFAHKANEGVDCCPETVLHNTFKTELYKILKEHLDNNKEFICEWNCNIFPDRYKGNLLKRIGNVYMERDLGVCRPDILLTDNDDKPYIAIEIVVTHKPEEQTIKYYKDNNIYLYQINLESDNDLKNIEIKAKYPDFFDACNRHKCKTCGQYLTKREIIIKEQMCNYCYKPMLFSYGTDEIKKSRNPIKFNQNIFFPKDYSRDEIEYVLKNSVKLRRTYSIVDDGVYIYNTCSRLNCQPNYCYDSLEMIEYSEPKEQKMQLISSKTSYYCDKCKNNSVEVAKCGKCNQNLTQITTYLYSTKCHTCKSPIVIADCVEKIDNGKEYDVAPSWLSKDQIDYLNRNGANIRLVKSGLFVNSFNANVCPVCGDFGNKSFEDVDCKPIAKYSFLHCYDCDPIQGQHIDYPTEKCSQCGRVKIRRTLIVVEAYCYKCKRPIKVAFIKEPDGYSFRFNSVHRSTAAKYGVVFQDNEKKPMVCFNCDAPISEYYINKYIHCKEIMHESSSYCPYCYKPKTVNDYFANENLNNTSDEFPITLDEAPF